jgi:pimeloyl-ACP methyl ester carboxylesterase
MRRTRRHAEAPDGTRLAWSTAGAGSPAVLLTDGIGCAGYIWRRLAPALAKERRVLHWNYRGHGESDPPRDPERATVADCVSDLLAVLDAAGEERAVLAGHSMGVQVVLEAHRRAPGRVAGLVLLCGAPGRLLDTFHDTTVLRTVLPYARAAIERWPVAARSAFRALVTADVAIEYALAFEVNRALVRRDDLLPYFEDLARVDPGLFVRLLASAAEHDATGHLPEIRVPTLVVAGVRDSFTPMHLSVAMHEAITGSELLVLPGGTHVGPLEHPELVEERVRAFLAARAPASRPPRPSRAARPAAPARPARRPPAGKPPRPRAKAAPAASPPERRPKRRTAARRPR